MTPSTSSLPSLSRWKNVLWNKQLRRGIAMQPHCPAMQDWPTPTINHSYIMLLRCLHVENPLIPSETWTNSFSRVPLWWIILTLYAERLKWCTCILPSSSWKLLFRHSCCSNLISLLLLLLLIWFSLTFYLSFDLRQSVSSLETHSGCISIGTTCLESVSMCVPRIIKAVLGNGHNSALRFGHSDTKALLSIWE